MTDNQTTNETNNRRGTNRNKNSQKQTTMEKRKGERGWGQWARNGAAAQQGEGEYCTGQFSALDKPSAVAESSSYGTRVQLVMAVEMLSAGTFKSIWLIADTTPVSLKAIGRPHSLITFHCCGERINESRGKLGKSFSLIRKVASSL